MNKNKYLNVARIRRRLLAAGAALPALAWTRAVRAQSKPPLARVGILHAASAGSSRTRIEALREGLRDLGYVEGKNLTIEFRFADEKYQRLNELAAELVRLKVDVIVTSGTPGARAAKQATATIPIVMAVVGDPVAAGVVTSLARPGGNITGSSMFSPEIHGKRLELLKEAMPSIRRVAILMNPENPAFVTDVKELDPAGKSLNVELRQFGVRGPGEFDRAFLEMTKQRIDVVVMLDDAILNANVKRVADIAAKLRLPAAGNTLFAEAGGLIGYGINQIEMFRRSATLVDKILKGAKPSDLPIERATVFELLINRKAAKALGVTIPPSILVRATKVIE